MGLFKKIFFPSRPSAAAPPRRSDGSLYSELQAKSNHVYPINARYDAAQTTERNARHWGMSDNLSANAANTYGIRQITRNRARYEEANNSYCDGIIDTLANWLLGPCPVLQMRTGDEELDEQVEYLFNQEWAAAVNLGRKLKILHKARIRDGEGFAQFYSNDKNNLMLTLDLMNFECDRVTSFGADLNDVNNIDGIILDSNGNPKEYKVLTQHPGDSGVSAGLPFHSVTVAAQYMLHWYDEKRPEQRRGVTELMSALELFGTLRDYTTATLRAAQAAANITAIFTTNGPTDDEYGDTETEDGEESEIIRPTPTDVWAIPNQGALVGPQGFDAKQMKAEQPTATFAEFQRRIINEAGRGRNMPLNIASGNSEGYNYASGRLDHQSFELALNVDRRDVRLIVLDKIFSHFWNELIQIPEYRSYAARARKKQVNTLQRNFIPSHTWMFAGVIHVDPSKTANAFKTLFEVGGDTLANFYAQQGKDWRKEIKQWEEEHLEMVDILKARGAVMSATSQSEKSDQSDSSTKSQNKDKPNE